MKKVFGFLRRVFLNRTALYVLVLLVLAGAAGYFFWQNKQNVAKLNNPNQASAQEVEELTKRVGKLMDLPKDEKPTIISVVDKDKVKTQAFFTNAENGDKVLVYTAAKKAILYRPATGKIIEVGPVDIAPTTNFKVALYSATGDTSNLDAIESKLKESVTNLEYPIKELAKSKTDKVLVVDINGGKTVEAEQIAKILGGEVSALPKGEAAPAADFLVISGK